MNTYQKILAEIHIRLSGRVLLYVPLWLITFSLNPQLISAFDIGDFKTSHSSYDNVQFLLSVGSGLEKKQDVNSDIVVVNREAPWDKWKYQLQIKLTERDSETANLLPVDITFAVLAEEIDDPFRELRLVRKVEGELLEVPFQLWNVSIREKDADGVKSLPTLSGTITFFDQTEDDRDTEYLLLYGNPAAEKPTYLTDLSVSGQAPELVVENAHMKVALHSSGQLKSVKLEGSEQIIDSPHDVIHWNPGIFIPTRYWAHSWAWDPPEVVEEESGPLFVILRRSGSLPEFPEMRLSITYRFFSNLPVVESSCRMEFNDDIGVVALRNDQLVFNENIFSHFSWQNSDAEIVTKSFDDYEPINDHGDILRIRPNTGFVAFFDEAKGIGAATIRLASMNEGPHASPPVLFDHATYLTNSHDMKYWFRPLVYFNANYTRQMLITIPKGSIYSEKNIYLFFTPEKNNPVAPVQNYRRAADNPPMINLGSYELPPAY